MIEIYTDGGCRNNPGPGAWAYIVVENGNEIYRLGFSDSHTTNNKMELSAIFCALVYAKSHGVDNATIYSDSQYAVNAINVWYDKWYAEGSLPKRKNLELLKAIKRIKGNHRIAWIKGHAECLYNIQVDEYVNRLMDARVQLPSNETIREILPGHKEYPIRLLQHQTMYPAVQLDKELTPPQMWQTEPHQQ